jgi:hypothetical protein
MKCAGLPLNRSSGSVLLDEVVIFDDEVVIFDYAPSSSIASARY